MSAELEYMFRHALVCEGSYQLLLPHERAALHRVAMDLVPVDPADPDACAAEIARHAGQARDYGHDDPTLRDQECEHLLRAARKAGAAWDQRSALAHFTRLLDRDTHDSTRRVAALSGLAGTYMNMGNRSAAKPLIAPGIEAARQAGATLHEAKLRRMMGELLLEAGDFEGAQHHANLAWQAGTRHADKPEQAQAGLLISRIMAARRDDEAALRMMEQLYSQADTALTRSQVANALGVFFARRHLDEKARHWLEIAAAQAAARTAEAGLRHQHAVALGNLGNVLDYLGDEQAAAAAYQQALEVHQSNGAHSWAALQYWNLGLLRNNRVQPDKALPLLHKASEMFQELGQTLYLRQCRAGIASALLYAGKVAEAEQLAGNVVPDKPDFAPDEFTLEAQNVRIHWALLRGDEAATTRHIRRLRELADAVGDEGEVALFELRLRLIGRAPDLPGLIPEIAALRQRFFTHEGRVSQFAPLLVRMDEAELGRALWFRGHVVPELTPGLRAYLVDWLAAHQPQELQRLQSQDAPVWAALTQGL